MRELRAYRKALRELGPPEPIEDDEADEDGEEKAQNEPTEPATAASDGAAEGCEMSSSRMGVPPMSSSIKECMGEAPMLREDDDAPRESSG